jgi:hypothetical protein
MDGWMRTKDRHTCLNEGVTQDGRNGDHNLKKKAEGNWKEEEEEEKTNFIAK